MCCVGDKFVCISKKTLCSCLPGHLQPSSVSFAIPLANMVHRHVFFHRRSLESCLGDWSSSQLRDHRWPNCSRAWCQPAQTGVVHSEPFPLRRWPMCSQSSSVGLHRQPPVRLWSYPDHVAHRWQLPGIQVWRWSGFPSHSIWFPGGVAAPQLHTLKNCVQPLYTTQHRTVLITYPLNMQTIIIALM